ncbi:Stromal membrane-associated protein 2 [Halotydeus destructor]|nr:Stromal membrane-associated protein 2 [Halotydeus destructor]
MFAKNAMNDQHSKRVSEVSQRPENKYCADCGYPDPDWASYTIGVFLCNNCASVHRSIGVHISRTKSVKLDKWEKTYVSRMEEVGNERAKELYEKFVPIYYPRPKYGGTQHVPGPVDPGQV